MPDIPPLTERFLARWHGMLAAGDPWALDDLVRDDVTIRSPMFFKPKGPKPYVMGVLQAVNGAFQDFRYTKEWIDGPEMILEFEARVGEIGLKGIDRIRLDDEGRMAEIEVLIRPLNGLQALGSAVMAWFAEREARPAR